MKAFCFPSPNGLRREGFFWQQNAGFASFVSSAPKSRRFSALEESARTRKLPPKNPSRRCPTGRKKVACVETLSSRWGFNAGLFIATRGSRPRLLTVAPFGAFKTANVTEQGRIG